MDRLAAEFDTYVRARTPALPCTAYLLTGGRSVEVPTDGVPEPRARGHSEESHVTRLALKTALARLTPKQRASSSFAFSRI